MTRTGAQLTRSLTVPIVAAGAAATKYTYDFDQSMNHISALVGANTKQMDYYRSSILKLAPAVGQGPTELADALYFVTSSGFKGAAAMRVLEASARGAASGLGDTQTIADLVTSAINVYGEKNLSAARAVDVLTAAVKDGKGEPADYAQAMGRVIPVAQNLGISFDQVGAALAALTLGGFSADKATTGLTSIFTNLSKQTTTGATALHKVGLSYAGIRAEIKDKGLLPALLDVNQAFDGNSIALRKVFANGKAIVPFLSLTGQAAKKNVGIFNDLANSTGASAEAFRKQSQSDAFEVQQSLAKIQVAAVHAGGIILPVFADVASSASGVADAFGELPAGTQRIVIEAGLAVAALGPLVSTAGNVAKTFDGLRTAAIGASSAEGLGGLAALLGNPVFDLGALGVGVAALGTYAVLTAHQIDDLSGAFQRAIGPIATFNGLVNTTKNLEHNYTAAQHTHTAALHAHAAAQRNYNKTVREFGKNSLEAKQALDQLNASQDNEWLTSEQQQLAHDKLNRQLEKQQAAYSKIVHSSDSFTAATWRQIKALKEAHVQDERRHGGSYLASSDLARLAHLADNYASKQDTLSKRLAVFAGHVDQTNPKLAKLADQQAADALAAEHLARKLGTVPTQKQINVYYKNNMAQLIEQARELAGQIAVIPSTKTVSIQFAQGHGTPLYNPPPKAAGATGAIVNRPTYALIGEKEPEAVIPLSRMPGARPLPDGQVDPLAGRHWSMQRPILVHQHFQEADPRVAQIAAADRLRKALIEAGRL